MRQASNIFAAIACICLLALQASGLHLHVDAAGHDAGVHSDHLHHNAAEGHSHHGTPEKAHDHSAEADVSLFEQLSASWSQLIPILIAFGIAAYLVVLFRECPSSRPRQQAKVRRRGRWRPPLRAPPISL